MTVVVGSAGTSSAGPGHHRRPQARGNRPPGPAHIQRHTLGAEDDPPIRAALGALRGRVETLRVLGSYPVA